MRRPDNELIALVNLGPIAGVSVSYEPIGIDTADTEVTFYGVGGERVTGWLHRYRKYVELTFTHSTVAKVLPEYLEQVQEWRRYEKQRKRDLADYRRLKRKFESEGVYE